MAKRRGIVTIANDKVYDWLLPFLESHAATNASTPLYVIPYDDNVGKTRQACKIYNAEFIDPGSAELDALARRLYPLFPKHRRRLRKFLSLVLPLDEVVYVDVDIVLFRDFTQVFECLKPGEAEFIVASATTDYVYNKKAAGHDFLREGMLFNDGFFATSNTMLSLQDFYDVIEKDEKLFHAVRQRGMLFAQPLTNFVVHRRGLKIVPLYDCIPGASGESFYKAEGVSFQADGPVDQVGNGIYFAHWAGAVSLPGRRVFDAAWHDFASKAIVRMKNQSVL